MIRTSGGPPPWRAPIFGAIFDEIAGQNWALPMQTSIEELGLALGTHPGLRRERNEDRIAVARVRALNGELYTLAILCDGVGGSESGDRAATLAIASVVYQLAAQNGRPGLKDLATMLVKGADEDVRGALQGRGATTIVLLLATPAGLIVCASVGDSRAYRWAPNNAAFDQVTVDDTIENELRNLPGDHAALLQERGLRGRLSQAVGEDGRTAEDLRVQVHTRERFLNGVVIGSDGLWRAAQDFAVVAAGSPSAADVVRRAINLANWVGGVDNTSIIAIEDLNCFCKPRVGETTPDAPWQPSITIWAHAHKLRLISPEWPRESVARAPARPKKKTTRAKGAIEAKQLQLESASAEDVKPKHKLEVTIGEAPKT
jgi:serine/threonine protein phosphatase PrpC